MTSNQKKPAWSVSSAIVACFVSLIATLAFSASPASAAEAPWWHVTAEPVPTYLHAGVAKDEVQELKVNASGGDVLWLEAYPELAVFPYNAEAKEVQVALEGLYGAGSVKVTGGPTGKTPGQIVTELEPYVITFVGPKSGRTVPIPAGAGFIGEACQLGIPGLECLTGSATIAETSKGQADGEILVTATNLGTGAANGGTEPMTLSDVVPAGFEAVGVSGMAFEGTGPAATELACSLKGKNGVAAPACSFEGSVFPFTALTLHLQVDVAGAKEGERKEDVASVSGGGARAVSVSRKLALGESTPFGLSDYEFVNEDEGGRADTQAGSHPFQQTTTVILNQIPYTTHGQTQQTEPTPVTLAKDLHSLWPAGLVGNPASLPQCPLTDFLNEKCPPDTAVGAVRTVFTLDKGTFGPQSEAPVTPLFNLVPSPGEPARLGTRPGGLPVYFDPSVRSGRDYGITVNSENITQLVGFRAIEVTVWGTPGASSHDQVRGNICLGKATKGETCPEPTRIENPTAFLSLPTACSGQPQVSTMTGDSWAERKPTDEQPQLAEYVMPALDGCDALPFKPSIVATPDGKEASKPTGLSVDVHVPQAETLNPEGLAVADPKDITVVLPVGVAVNPSSADGLEACTGSQGDLAPGPPGQLGSPGDQIGFEGSGVLPGEPGVSTALFSGRLPESIAADVAAENGEILEGEKTLSPGQNFCANASKLGEVTIKTPLLPVNQPIKGFVYLASQEANPFGSVLAMYIVVEDPVSGTLVKLAGDVSLCKSTGEAIGGLSCQAPGQIITTFENSPQAPFEDAEIHFFGGERAPLATPTRCGSYTTRAAFTPWTAESNPAHPEPPVDASSTFNITEGPNHSPCPGASLPFNPTLTGGAENVNAGAFSPFTATMSRLSGEQNLQSLEVHLPPGLSGILSGVELCPEPQANEGECGPNSLIGETTVAVGVGGEPYTVSGGKFYLTGPYNGSSGCTVGQAGCAPFGITFEVPAKAGPLDLAKTKANHPACDCVLVRGKIEINPLTSAITITSNPPGTPDAIPTSLEGIPLEIQHVNAVTTRNDFQFNPTNCSKMEVTGTIHSSEGGTDTVGVPFQVTNCAALKFTPKFKVSTNAKTSKSNGASLTATVSEPAGSLGTQANLTKVKVELPKQLPSRLTTLQKACTAKQFEANPAACPAESKIGYAKVLTPLVPVPLEGPAIFVSHGGEAFPSLTMVLQGYGVTIDLVGSTFISKSGVTSTTFKTVPDQPFSSFALTLPTGKYSALTALGNVCTEKLTMPTEFVGQNGMEIHQSTPISVTGCKQTKTLTRAQKLKAALAACHKKSNKAKRMVCEKAARHKYGPVKRKKRKK
jgi:hypothetical protein